MQHGSACTLGKVHAILFGVQLIEPRLLQCNEEALKATHSQRRRDFGARSRESNSGEPHKPPSEFALDASSGGLENV